MYLLIDFFIFLYAFRFSLAKWFIYSLNYLFLNIWYFFIHKFNWFPQSKILCFWMFILFIYSAHACLCVCDLLARLFAYSTCTLFVHAALLFKTYICLYLCWSVYVYIYVFVFTISCKCFCINCQTTVALQQSQSVLKKFSCQRRKCSTRCLL